MTLMAPKASISRRQFVKDAGGLVIGFSLIDPTVCPRLLGLPAAQTSPAPPVGRLDAWLQIEKHGAIRILTGKTEIGMGVETALTQIIAEELDVSPDRVRFVMGDTAVTPDQGGVGGSTSIMLGSKPLRNAAASARLALVQLAARRLGVTPDELQVANGIVSVKADSSRSITYWQLAGEPDLHEALRVSGERFALNVVGPGKPKDPSSYKIVGQSLPRVDLPPKLLGQFQYVTDIRLPGMLHGRVVRPPAAGASLVTVDESSVQGIPGFVRTVVKGNFVGVVGRNEWAAIRAAKELRIKWTDSGALLPAQSDLYRQMRAVAPKASKMVLNEGDTSAALAQASQILRAGYDWPFQSHSTMGPGCAMADVKPEGITTVWSGGQKPHDLQKGIADLLGVPADKVRVIWVEDAGSYGRPGFEDTAADAALLSQAVGKPVRVQWSRQDMTGWGTKGPAVVCDLTGGLDAQGNVSGIEITSRAFSGGETYYHPDSAGNFLAGRLKGVKDTTGIDEFVQWGVQSVGYRFPNIHATAHVVPALVTGASPLRTSHLRDPEGPAMTFAVESFVDELASAAGSDPIEFRLKYVDDPRIKAVLNAVAERSGWEHRASPRKDASTTDVVAGRGVAIGVRGGTYVATVAAVEVNRRTGALWVKRLVCVHDCGLIVNPDGLRGVIAANLIQSLSRSMKEEVMFDRSNVTSVDWLTYPVVRSTDVPPQVDIVLLNHPEMPPAGAGEPSSRPTAAAIGNAIFDACGARVRQAPLTQQRIAAALA